MANLLPPVPYKSRMLNDKGFLNDTWTKFFREIFLRAGGSMSAPSGSASVTQNATDIIDLQNRISAKEQEPS